MQRWALLFFALAAAVLAVVISRQTWIASVDRLTANAADAGGDPSSGALTDGGTATSEKELSDELSLHLNLQADSGWDNGPAPADGTPSLDSKAPRTVRIGVVLVGYQGAEGASPRARTKAEATELAQKLSVRAKTNFGSAVAGGDKGSNEDIGRIPRGTLDGAVEYAVFNLAVGSVSDPIDTPRGFWIVKRSE